MAEYSPLDDVFQWRDKLPPPDFDEPSGWSRDQTSTALITLDNISGLSDPLDLGDCLIRLLTEDDIQQIRATEDQPESPFPLPLPPTYSPWYELRDEPFPLVVDIPIPAEPFDRAVDYVDRVRRKIQSALHLAILHRTFSLHPPVFYQSGVKGSVAGEYFLRPRHPSWSQKSGTEPHKLDGKTAADLKEYYSRQAQLTDSRVRLALRRFNITYQRHATEDELIDCWIALEALFSEGPSDIRFKAAMRIAYYVDATDRQQIFNDLYDSYAVRNGLVQVSPKTLTSRMPISRRSGPCGSLSGERFPKTPVPTSTS